MTKRPRYLDLAADMRRQITDGAWGLGDQLPTEHQLCAQHRISRHTARAALQVLVDEGLVDRKPGLGTTVIANDDLKTFTQSLGGLDDLMQYAHQARLRTNSTKRITLASTLARQLGAKRGSSWLMLTGVRETEERAIAATNIYVSDIIDVTSTDLLDPQKAVTEHIEAKLGIIVTSIRQTIKADILSETDAVLIGAKPGQAALRTIRKYYDVADRLFVISDTRHPSDRFAYDMIYRRSVRSK